MDQRNAGSEQRDEGRTAIVTGASRGLGLALASALVERGWTVVGDAPAYDQVDLTEPTALVLGNEAPLPCTPYGIVELLRRHDVAIAGAEVVVVGRGVTVGRPLGLLLTRRSENATVTLCHTGTVDLASHVRKADIVVAAAGVPGIISADMVKPGAAVLDVGVSRVDGKIAGDVADEVWETAGWVSPNPGGVGPMTRAMLLANVVSIAESNSAARA